MLDRWGKQDETILNESIEAIRTESENMQHLIEQLLFLARGDSGRTPIRKTDFDLSEMIRPRKNLHRPDSPGLFIQSGCRTLASAASR